MTTDTVHNEGADLVYDREGDGPVLLLISGGGGEAARYAQIAELLADEFTVVSYDRRGNSRSTGGGVDLDMAQQARDAVAVLNAVGGEPAYVFGNSAGGSVALRLATDHPDALAGVIVHEAPTIVLLPDAEQWQNFSARVRQTFADEGTTAAMALFLTSLVGIMPPGHGHIPSDAVPNGEFFLAHEYAAISGNRPDLARIRANGVPMVTARGRDSADAYYARSAQVQAEGLGCVCVDFPSNHMGFLVAPRPFADAIRAAIKGMR
jgi:pimeloyl-ACP methyl ester carboxylesterase